MSNPEAIRLARDVPGIDDSPSVYKAKLDKVVRRLSAVRERALASLSVSDDPDEFRRVSTSNLQDWLAKADRAEDEQFNREADELLSRFDEILGNQ